MNVTAVEKQSDDVCEQEARAQGFEIIKLEDRWNPTPWFVMRSGDHARVSDAFASRAEALDSIPGVLRQHARHISIREQGYRDEWDSLTKKWNLYRVRQMQSTRVGGPFDSQEEALDELPRIIREAREREEHIHATAVSERIRSAKILPDYLGTKLEKFTGPKEAVEIAREFVSTFALRANPPAQGLVLAGGPGQGKTRLACWIAEELARSGSRTRYTSITEVLQIPRRPDLMPELAYPQLLVLDWDGIETTIRDKAVQRLTERMALDTVPHVTGLLDARATVPTILVADCTLDRLDELIGLDAFMTLKKRSWKLVQFDK